MSKREIDLTDDIGLGLKNKKISLSPPSLGEVLLATPVSSLRCHELEPAMIPLLEQCVHDIELELIHHPEIKMFGKTYHQQRSVGFFSDTADGYNYSTSKTPANKMKPSLLELLDYINNMFNSSFNGILVNKYEHGGEYIGKHSDDERTIEPKCGVISVSFGATRKFRIRNKETGKIVLDLPMEPNKIIQMAGDFQREFTHEIPAEKKIREPRYSFTFRRHL
jgi:alkylated DNA repair dioxygenase AlkB